MDIEDLGRNTYAFKVIFKGKRFNVKTQRTTNVMRVFRVHAYDMLGAQDKARAEVQKDLTLVKLYYPSYQIQFV